jgi:translation initiation factor 1
MPTGRDPNLVWSSEDGDLRGARGRRAAAAAGAGAAGGEAARSGAGALGGTVAPGRGGRVKVRRETAGRRGKAVTTVSGLPVDDDALRVIAARLKKRCGVGGSAKDGVIELQGDHRTIVVDELRAAGYDVVLAGG